MAKDSGYVIKDILVDADALVYTAAAIAEKDMEENILHNIDVALMILKRMINTLFEKLSHHLKIDMLPHILVRSGHCHFYLTSNDQSNFRFKVGTIKEYKANRKNKEKPFYYNTFREYLIKEYRATVVSGYEADDAISIHLKRLNPETTIILGDDKDFRQLNCWLFWYKASNKYPRPPIYLGNKGYIQLERHAGAPYCMATGEYQLAYQMLIGDTGDNIPNLARGWGPIKAYDYLKDIEYRDSAGWGPLDHVKSLYHKTYGEVGINRYNEVYTLIKLLEEKPNG